MDPNYGIMAPSISIAFQYILQNSPALLFVGWERGGRSRLNIGPISCIVTLVVRVARPPNTPVYTHFAPALSTVRAPSVSAHPLQRIISPLEPRAKVRSRSHEPAPPRYPAKAHILGQPVHQSQDHHTQRKTSGYPLQGCHLPRTSAPEGPEAKSQCLCAMSQCHHLGGIIKPEWEWNPHQSTRVTNTNKAARPTTSTLQ